LFLRERFEEENGKRVGTAEMKKLDLTNLFVVFFKLIFWFLLELFFWIEVCL
jgi:hypothetical protein